MSNLWSKDHSESGAYYVNLFATTSSEKWPHEIWTQDPKNFDQYRSLKDNQHATELRHHGNTKFRAGQWATAMNFYNKSLCFTEINTENCALAYAKRSECFYELELYGKALNDIKLAIDANIPNRFHAKLQECKQKCQQNLLESCQTHNQMNKPIRLSFASNEQYPCMANVLELKQNQEFGRHLIAREDIAVGKTVLIETDFISVQCMNDADGTADDDDDDDVAIVCDTCFQSNMNFIACDQCADAVFCDFDCIAKNSTHKWVCGTFFAQLHSKIKFQIQAMLVAISTFPSVEDLMHFIENVQRENAENMPKSLLDAKSKYHFFLKLQKSKKFGLAYELHAKQIYETLAMLPKVNALFDSIEKQRFLMHLILHHLLVIQTNGIISGDPWSVVSVFNVLSMLNHSCAPNLYHPRFGKQQYCVTIRPIRKGQQLFISYLSPNDRSTTEQRQQKFKYSWDFECMCERCCSNQIVELSPRCIVQQIQIDPFYQFILTNDGNSNENRKLFEYCLKFLNKYGHLQWSYQIFTITSIFMNLYIDMLSR